jgi:acyl-CoA synthetase (AMP-forming)/AMP-acid ligase II
MTGPSATPTPPAVPVSDTLWALVERAAETYRDHVLLADDHGRQLTAAELKQAAESVAAALAALGIGPNRRVSWQLPTMLEGIVVLLALARLGAAQNPLIPVLRERDVAFIAAQVESEFLLVPEEWRGFPHGEMARELARDLGCTVVVCDHATDPEALGGALRLPTGDPASLPPPPSSADEVRWYYYSSGTTADPKGARHTDRSVIASASAVIHNLGVRSDDVMPFAIPIAHIGGVTMLVASLVTGMRHVYFEAFDPTTTPERMAAHGSTVLGSAVPFFLAYIAAQERHGREPLFPHLRVAVAGGAPLPAETSRAVRETLGIDGICNSWGMTEFPVVTFASPGDTQEVLDKTVGYPAPGVEVRVVDEEDRALPAGEDGELRIKGPQCFKGYVDSTLDAAAFDADGWLRTGDVGNLDADGRVLVTGRLKEIIIRNAENISALEVESELFRCPDIADVAVIGLPDPRTVERVCAVVVPEAGAKVNLEAVVAYCRSIGMTPYKMPERVEIVDEIPRNALGKALKNELRARFGEARTS